MKRVLLALGNQNVEKAVSNQLDGSDYEVVGAVVYREAILREIEQKYPDIIVINEGLSGKENIMTMLYNIRRKYPNMRIVFLASKRNPGDEFLATLVNYSIYDITYEGKTTLSEIVSLIKYPKEYKDVSHLLPVPKVDERTKKMIFEAPEPVVQKETIVREVIVDNTNDINYEPTDREETIEKATNSDELTKEKKTSFFEKFSKVNSKNDEVSIEEEDLEYSKVSIPAYEYKSQENISNNNKFQENINAKLTKGTNRNNETKQSHGKSRIYPEETKSDNFKRNYENMQYSGSHQKVITFMGSKNGVGNTSIAINVAVSLANKDKNVLYIELNDKYPAVSYWYELSNSTEGIDTALKAIQDEKYESIDKAIIKMSELKEKAENTRELGHMQANYRKFPSSLDFMFYSDKYLLENKTVGQVSHYKKDELIKNTKDLIFYLMLQYNYDFIIIDVQPNITSMDVLNSLVYSNKIFITMTQDVSSIGTNLFVMDELKHKGIKLDNKISYILNKYERTDLTIGDIKEWIKSDFIYEIPYLNKEFINANYDGLPLILSKKNSLLKSQFSAIEKSLF